LCAVGHDAGSPTQEISYDHNPISHFDTYAAWRAATVAAQPELGLLPQRRHGAGSDHPAHFIAYRTYLILPDLHHEQLNPRSDIMSISTILLIVLVLILIGALPTWPHSASWGYYPSGGMGLVVIILLILLLTGRI
jgi:hypothetical protein